MFNKEFLKNLTILYVEDDLDIQKSLNAIFSKVFKEVIVSSDGDEGLEKFKQYTKENPNKIDAIVSDIKMPNLSGIDMVKEIRKTHSDIPVIFTTAHGEANYLMESIKLKVDYYAMKPIDTTELIKNISKFCMIEHNKKLVEKKTKEISHYIDIINHFSSIFKVDLAGNIMEANEFLAEVSQYCHEELLQINIKELLHNDTLQTTYKDIEQTINNKNTYKGKVKFKTKENVPFYLNSTVMPNYDDTTSELIGYIWIGIDQTNEELEKQKTMQRVRKNIVEQRSKESLLTNQIKELEKEIERLKLHSISNTDIKIIAEKLNKEKEKVARLNNQIEHYEREIKTLLEQKEHLVHDTIGQKTKETKQKKSANKDVHILQTKIIELQSKISKLEAQKKPIYSQ